MGTVVDAVGGAGVEVVVRLRGSMAGSGRTDGVCARVVKSCVLVLIMFKEVMAVTRFNLSSTFSCL